MTARESILEYIATMLVAVPNVTVYRSRLEAIERSEGSAIVVMPKDEPVENRAGGGSLGLVLREFSVCICVITRAQTGGYTADQVADPIMETAHSLVMADTTLGGLVATTIEKGTEWDFEAADGTALAAEMTYIVRYQTRANSLC